MNRQKKRIFRMVKNILHDIIRMDTYYYTFDEMNSRMSNTVNPNVNLRL